MQTDIKIINHMYMLLAFSDNYVYTVRVHVHTASKNVSDWWLAYWISHSHSHPGTLLNTTIPHSTPNTLHSTPLDYTELLDSSGSGSGEYAVLREASDNLRFYLGVYGGLAAANSVSALSSYNIEDGNCFVHACVYNSCIHLPCSGLYGSQGDSNSAG